MKRYILDCKAQAWPNGFPPVDSSKRRITFPNGRAFVVYADGTTWLLDQSTNEEYLMDPSQIPAAQWKDTILFTLPTWIYSKTMGRYVKFPQTNETKKSPKKSASVDKSESSTAEVLQVEVPKRALGDGKVVVGAAHVAGGRRRRRK